MNCRVAIPAGAAALLLALPLRALALPTISPDVQVIPKSTSTDITIQVDPSDTPLASFVLNISVIGPEDGIDLVDAGAGKLCWVSSPYSTSCDTSARTAGVGNSFGTDQSAPFTVGTIRVSGLTAGAELWATGNWTDGSFEDYAFSHQLAVVVPEPGALSLLGVGMLGLAIGGRRRRR